MPRGESRQRQSRRRIDGDLEPHPFELVERHERRDAARQHVGQLRQRDLAGDPCEFPGRPRRFDEAHVGTGFRVAIRPLDRGVEPLHRPRVGAGDDHELGITAGVGRLGEPVEHRRHGHDLLAREVSAALGIELVFEQDAGGACRLEGPHRPGHGRPGAVPRVAVGDQRNQDAVGDAPDALGHLAGRDESQVGHPQPARGRPESPEKEHLDARLLEDPGGEGVVRGQHPDEAGAGEERTELGGGGHGTEVGDTGRCAKPEPRQDAGAITSPAAVSSPPERPIGRTARA